MLNWIVRKLKFLLVAAALGGPFMAFAGWSDGERTRRIEREGVEGQAAVLGATRTKRSRGGTSYSLDLSWKDGTGAPRSADKVSISQAFADKIIRDDKLLVNSVRVKYLPDDPEKSGVIILDDAAEQEHLDDVVTYMGAGASAVGILGCAYVFGFRRWRGQASAPTPA